MNEKLIKEVKEFLECKGVLATKENIDQWTNFAEFQMDNDTYWSPCEDCDNPSCRKKEDFSMWFCVDQK